MNPTTLQVAASAAAHMKLAAQRPNQGLLMPHNFDSDEIIKIAAPYLGTILDCDLEIRLPVAWQDLLSSETVQ
jgi:homospermidine synthase